MTTQTTAPAQAPTSAIDVPSYVIGGLTDLVLHLGDRMLNLSSALEQVRGVSAGIDKIARQTNLLALNAAIEAARARMAARPIPGGAPGGQPPMDRMQRLREALARGRTRATGLLGRIGG